MVDLTTDMITSLDEARLRANIVGGSTSTSTNNTRYGMGAKSRIHTRSKKKNREQLNAKKLLCVVAKRLLLPAGGGKKIDFALLLSYWKKRISTTLQVYTAKFILEASVSKRNPQRRQDIVDSALLETYHVRAAQ